MKATFLINLKAITSALVLIPFFSVSVHAQKTGGSFELPDFKSGKAVWVLRAGASFNAVSGANKETTEMQWEKQDWDGRFKTNIGYDVTLGFNKSFGGSPIFWGMEIGLSSRGYKSSASWERFGVNTIGKGQDYHGKFEDISLLCHSVKFSPFTIGYRYEFFNNMAADIHLGAYVSYDYLGEMVRDYTDHVVSTSIYGNRDKLTKTSTSTKIKDIEDMQRLDAGLNLGVGFWFGRFNLDFTWQRGFMSMIDNCDETVTIGGKERERGGLFTNNLQLKLGYAF